jgi:putative transcriptional regulator
MANAPGRRAATTLEGKMLIAMPGMSDPRFERSVIFMCAHSEQGAMGIIVNKVTPLMSFGDLASQIDVLPPPALAKASPEILNMAVQYGGPVEPSRGFVLHSSDYFTTDSSMPIGRHLALTATLDVLKAMLGGEGPRHAMLALGYSGWAPGQLEDEIHHNGWLHCEADNELLFGRLHDAKYDQALRKIGVDPSMLSSDAGHA